MKSLHTSMVHISINDMFSLDSLNIYIVCSSVRSIERDMGSGLSKLLASWKYARMAIVIAFVLMTIIFPFHSTNR